MDATTIHENGMGVVARKAAEERAKAEAERRDHADGLKAPCRLCGAGPGERCCVTVHTSIPPNGTFTTQREPHPDYLLTHTGRAERGRGEWEAAAAALTRAGLPTTAAELQEASP